MQNAALDKTIDRTAKATRIPYTIIELNPDTVSRERKTGVPIHYGDATQEAVLRHAGIASSRVVVIAISDPAATRSITELARRLNGNNYIIVRTKFMSDIEEILSLGANCVVPEEFETSIEIFTRVLRYYLVPAENMEKLIAQVRADGYRMFHIH